MKQLRRIRLIKVPILETINPFSNRLNKKITKLVGKIYNREYGDDFLKYINTDENIKPNNEYKRKLNTENQCQQ